MLARSVRLFLVSVAVIAMAPFAATQTVTLGFDGAPDGELPWSEQGFVFTRWAFPSECGEALTQEGGNLALHAYSTEAPPIPTLSCFEGVTLSRADGGTFDALSLDVVEPLFDEYSECSVAVVRVQKNTSPDIVSSYGPGTIMLDWTDISELTVSLQVNVMPAGGPIFWNSCSGRAVLDNFVVNTPQAECLLVIGDGPGTATYFDGDMDHLFETQLDGVEDAHAVLMDEIPEFVLPLQRGRRDVTAVAPLGNGTLTATPVGDIPLDQPPAWMLDGDFAVQVLMWNPEVFPGQPEQYTAGLYVSIQPDGTVRHRALRHRRQGGMADLARDRHQRGGPSGDPLPLQHPGVLNARGPEELVTQRGDNPDESLRAVNGVPREQWVDGLFLAPHSAAWDAEGNLDGQDWNAVGRVNKLRRVGK